MFKTYPSHSRVKCRKAGCEKTIRKDRMSEHLKNVHGDTSGKLEGQQSLSQFFVPKTIEVEEFESEETEIPSTHQLDNVNTGENQLLSDLLKGLCEDEKRLEKEEVVKGPESHEGAKSLELQDFEEERKILAQLQNIRARTESTHSLGTCNRPQSETSDNANIEFGIPSKTAFEQFFQGHKRDQVPITTMPQKSSFTQVNDVESSLTQVNDVESSSKQVNYAESSLTQVNDDLMPIEVDGDNQKVEVIDSSSSTVAQKKPFFQRLFKSFKRRKVSSPNVNLSVTERLENIHEDVLVVQDTVKEVYEKLSELSLSKQVEVVETSQSKILARKKEEEANKVTDAKMLLAGNATSIADLLKYANGISVHPENPDVFICQCCYRSGKVEGLFKYNSSLGDDFRDLSMPREFRNLKTHIMSHLKTKSHIEKTKETEISVTQKQQISNRQHRVGMVLGRQAYKILKCGDSDLQYETDVVVLKEQGCDVGNINHSRKFVAAFKNSVHDCLMTKIQKLVNEPLPATGRPTPISVIADKLTPNRQTLQIVGFYGYVGKKIQPLIAGVPALTGGDGFKVTECVRNGLSNLEIPPNLLPSRVVGGAFDGEYFHLSVDTHFLNMLLVSEEARKWYTFQWDIAHIIELAEKDSMKVPACQSVKGVISTISDVSKSFSHGKSFRELVQEASVETEINSEDEDIVSPIEKVKPRVPGHFSDTRFATYSSVVLDKWLNNYPLYYKIMNREGSNTLDKINNAPFLLSWRWFM